MGIFKKIIKTAIDMTGYSYDSWDFGSVDCPDCGEYMMYDALKDRFKCPECGAEYDSNDLDLDGDDDDDMPACCSACGGPYPDCIISCKIFDD